MTIRGTKEPKPDTGLSRRERQIMDIIYRLGSATAVNVRHDLPDPPGDGAVRRMLVILEEKGFLKHSRSGKQHVYQPRVSQRRAKKSALAHVVRTFFNNSRIEAASTLFGGNDRLTPEEVEQLKVLIERSKPQAD